MRDFLLTRCSTGLSLICGVARGGVDRGGDGGDGGAGFMSTIVTMFNVPYEGDPVQGYDSGPARGGAVDLTQVGRH